MICVQLQTQNSFRILTNMNRMIVWIWLCFSLFLLSQKRDNGYQNFEAYNLSDWFEWSTTKPFEWTKRIFDFVLSEGEKKVCPIGRILNIGFCFHFVFVFVLYHELDTARIHCHRWMYDYAVLYLSLPYIVAPNLFLKKFIYTKYSWGISDGSKLNIKTSYRNLKIPW